MKKHPSQTNNSVSRRRFLRTTATAGVGATIAARAGLAAPKALGANDRVRVGAIGTGGRCRGLMSQLKKLPGNELVALSDVYEPNLLRAAQTAGTGARQFRDYRALLDSKEVDAVVIGSPDHWHKRMTIDAVEAGKDVYVENPSRIRSKKGSSWCAPSRRASASCRPARSSGVGSISSGARS